MHASPGDDQRSLHEHLLIPDAQGQDGRETARAPAPYTPGQITALHVIEIGDGVSDKKAITQSQEVAEASFAAVRDKFPTADEHTAFERDIVGTIFDAAKQDGASAIVYRARGGGRPLHFLPGDLSLELVTQTNRPVIALPRQDTDT